MQRHTDFGGFVCYFRDETQAHQKELLLAQVVEKSKQANQLKDKFVARLAMQLKAPLSSLQSIVELNYKNSKGNFNNELENACTQLSCVVQQLVNINKTDTGKLKLKMSAINLADLLKNTADILNKDSDDKNIIINNNVPIDNCISSDEKLIMQLIIQLASELIESTHQGKLSLNSELINEQGKHYLSLDFSINNLTNQGSFYSQLQMVCKQRSFESDINFDATLELRFFLSIFKMLGGKKITVHERGKTTSINLSLLVNTVELLPVSANKQKPITETTTHTEFNNTKSLLLVDDEPLVEMVIKAMLKDENVAIDYARNAIEAMLMVSQNNYDIILMDIVMPELSGTDAMLKIKKHNGDKQTSRQADKQTSRPKLLPTLQILTQIVMLSMLNLGLTICLKNQ
ncbi:MULTISPECIES: response regulator [unclassified Pseudoalteromonas]|uniref:response regulator n=1 Tax=unclassified Pseudoalteromonas TaxID=194690 RepID=UPI002359E35A|nr:MULTISPECIES: response regulator [unclassified Pseudoalteromonas]MDC9565553.1 response regulator [Pseudoalteromonas sp. GAB2316C]MDC9569884.1 response regulator [Pseudoalteromonas sp. GABNB9D]MDC9573995.1 response regulator [Pseudoalteromonas sp. GABNS16A]MDC9578401.1 response regulator [Pseudoalteromonas sp. GABNS16E]MDC9585981.1 response regulator [Pseudoalteromonas sp. GABNS16C]